MPFPTMVGFRIFKELLLLVKLLIFLALWDIVSNIQLRRGMSDSHFFQIVIFFFETRRRAAYNLY
jgi:hypothetical protein